MSEEIAIPEGMVKCPNCTNGQILVGDTGGPSFYGDTSRYYDIDTGIYEVCGTCHGTSYISEDMVDYAEEQRKYINSDLSGGRQTTLNNYVHNDGIKPALRLITDILAYLSGLWLVTFIITSCITITSGKVVSQLETVLFAISIIYLIVWYKVLIRVLDD